MNLWEEQRRKQENLFFKIALKWDLGIITKENRPESLGHTNRHDWEILCLIETASINLGIWKLRGTQEKFLGIFVMGKDC